MAVPKYNMSNQQMKNQFEIDENELELFLRLQEEQFEEENEQIDISNQRLIKTFSNDPFVI